MKQVLVVRGGMSHGRPLDRWTGQDSRTSSNSGMSNGCPMDVHMDKWIGHNSGTSLVSEGSMSNGCCMNVYWTGWTIPSGQMILMVNLDMSGVTKCIWQWTYIADSAARSSLACTT